MLELTVAETNRYTHQKNCNHEVTTSGTRAFLRVLILSGYVDVPRSRLYWEREKDAHGQWSYKQRQIWIYPIEFSYCWQQLRSIRKTLFWSPWYKQYIHDKPIRYGYKLCVGGTKLGYVNWFEPYQGSSTIINPSFSEFEVGAAVVLEYASELQEIWTDKHLFFDNFFTNIPLIE